MNLQNKRILITGGGSGIGLAIAKKLVQHGALVTIAGRNEAKLQTAQRSNPKLDYAVCDVTNDEQIAALVQTFESKNEPIDMLINNAGVFESIDYSKDSPSMDKQAREIDIDLIGPIRMVHHFLPMLKKRVSSAIVNVSSGLAFVPLTQAPVYSATKAGLHAWTRSLRYQIGEGSLKIFELMPPLVNTEMVKEFEGQKMMEPDALADALVKGLLRDEYEITPGQSSQLKMMSRVAPNFIFKAVNKQFA